MLTLLLEGGELSGPGWQKRRIKPDTDTAVSDTISEKYISHSDVGLPDDEDQNADAASHCEQYKNEAQDHITSRLTGARTRSCARHRVVFSMISSAHREIDDLGKACT